MAMKHVENATFKIRTHYATETIFLLQTPKKPTPIQSPLKTRNKRILVLSFQNPSIKSSGVSLSQVRPSPFFIN